MYVAVIALILAVVIYAGYAVFGSFAPNFTLLSSEAKDISITEMPSGDVAETRIIVKTPGRTTKITSPLTIAGTAVGPWFFEGSFPVSVLDGNGNVLAQGTAVAEGDWMTEDFVPFRAVVYFGKSPTSGGKIRLHKANASGLPEHEASFDVVVRF